MIARPFPVCLETLCSGEDEEKEIYEFEGDVGSMRRIE